jgi:hypothetical protein
VTTGHKAAKRKTRKNADRIDLGNGSDIAIAGQADVLKIMNFQALK